MSTQSSNQESSYKTDLDELTPQEERNLHQLFRLKKSQMKKVMQYTGAATITGALALGVLITTSQTKDQTSYSTQAASSPILDILVPQEDHSYSTSRLTPAININDSAQLDHIIMYHNGEFVCQKELPPYNCTLYPKEGSNTLEVKAYDAKGNQLYSDAADFHYEPNN